MLLCVAGAILGRQQTAARTSGQVDLVSRIVRAAVEPLASVATYSANGCSDFLAGITSGGALRAENRRLRDLASGASLYSETLDRLQKDNERLRKLLDLPPTTGRSRVAGSVTGYFPTENRVTVNLGKGSGVRAGMPVVTADGLVGRVQTVDETSCQVLLVTSPRLQIGATVPRDPPPVGIVRGESLRQLVLDYLDMQASVQVGDKVQTSGYSEFVPPGIPIGVITQVQDDPEYGSRRCLIFPAVQIGKLRDVYVLR